ncbi:MAG: toll/interleukin-1 receptor domain-containing protein [Candidatus Bipolaricaulota bacterium]
MPGHVFVSYCHKDHEFVVRLVDALKRHGVPVWWDHDMRLGDIIEGGVEDALCDADAFLVVLSRRALASNWVQLEVAAAMGRNRAGSKLRVIPLLRRGCTMPALLAAYKGFGLPQWSDARVAALARELREALGIPGVTPGDVVTFWRQQYERGTASQRVEAIEALFEIRSDAGVTALFGDIELQAIDVKRQVAKRMTYYLRPELLPVYRRLAAASDALLTPSAWTCLVNLGERQGLTALRDLLAHGDDESQRNVLRNLSRITGLLPTDLAALVRMVRSALRDSGSGVRPTALDTVMKLHALGAVDDANLRALRRDIHEFLGDRDKAVAQAAAAAARYLGFG